MNGGGKVRLVSKSTNGMGSNPLPSSGNIAHFLWLGLSGKVLGSRSYCGDSMGYRCEGLRTVVLSIHRHLISIIIIIRKLPGLEKKYGHTWRCGRRQLFCI